MSSQTSRLVTMPLPHTALEVQGLPTSAQTASASSWHPAEQPSPPFLFPSSHCSSGSSMLLPHVSESGSMTPAPPPPSLLSPLLLLLLPPPGPLAPAPPDEVPLVVVLPEPSGPHAATTSKP